MRSPPRPDGLYSSGGVRVPTADSSAAATLYISAFNDGLAGTYSFDRAGAGASVLLIPV